MLLRPRLLRDTSRIETKTTVLGAPVAGPVLVAPTAGHGLVHIDGEAASARGAAAAGSLMVLSMRGSSRVEAVAAAGPYWQQIYVLSDRGVSDEVAVRAAAAGARAIVLTVDTPFVTAKAGGGYPSTMPLQGVIEALDRREAGETGLLAVPVRPDDISRLAELTGLPVVVKGVLRGDEARALSRQWCLGHRRCTHGGRQLDGVVPTPRALVEVVDAVGDTEVYVDGGVRTGIDVLRALGLGARAVLLGRPVLWALATGGPMGSSTCSRTSYGKRRRRSRWRAPPAPLTWAATWSPGAKRDRSQEAPNVVPETSRYVNARIDHELVYSFGSGDADHGGTDSWVTCRELEGQGGQGDIICRTEGSKPSGSINDLLAWWGVLIVRLCRWRLGEDTARVRRGIDER